MADSASARSRAATRVEASHEKPELPVVVSAGIYVMEPQTLECVPPTGYFDFPDLVHALLEANHPISAYRYGASGSTSVVRRPIDPSSNAGSAHSRISMLSAAHRRTPCSHQHLTTPSAAAQRLKAGDRDRRMPRRTQIECRRSVHPATAVRRGLRSGVPEATTQPRGRGLQNLDVVARSPGRVVRR